MEDGCEKVVVVLSRPKNFRKKLRKSDKFSKFIIRKYPKTIEAIYSRASRYNEVLEELLKDENIRENVLVLGPEDNFGIDTLSKNKEALEKIYKMGYEDGVLVKEFLGYR